MLPLDPPPDPPPLEGVTCVALALALWGADNPTPPLPKFIKVFPTTVFVGLVSALVPSSNPKKLEIKSPILRGISSRGCDDDFPVDSKIYEDISHNRVSGISHTKRSKLPAELP